MESSRNRQKKAVESFIARVPADKALGEIERFESSGVLALDPADDIAYGGGKLWSNDVSRRVGRKTHGWFFLRYWYSAWPTLSSTVRKNLVDVLRGMLTTWSDLKDDAEMAYHDETTAQRVINFAVFFDIAQNDLDGDLPEAIKALLEEETQILASESFYAGSNNHGMFQDVAILVVIAYGHCLEEAEQLQRSSINRLAEYFNASFGSDGIHKENNPTYHLMVSRYLAYVIAYCETMAVSTDVDELRKLFSQADLYGAFALAPDNRFVPISDTKKGNVSLATAEDTFGRGSMFAVINRGETGETPNSKTFVSEESGYAVFRSDWTEGATYLFYSSAYNADYHKHSDESSLYYFANGRELIAEAGPNGYEYADPLTQYAFSSAAHNSLLVDGRGLPRVDNQAEETTLHDRGTTKDSLHVVGKTGRYPGVDWSRKIDVPNESAGSCVQITDKVTSEDEHSYTFLWHLGEDLVPVVRGNAIDILDPATEVKIGELTWGGDTPVGVRHIKGQRHPYHQGWSFPKMGKAKPNSSVEIEFRSQNVSIIWELRSGDFRLKNRGVTPMSNWQTHAAEKPVNYLLEGADEDESASRLAIVFTAIGQLHDFTYNYRASMEGFPGAVLYILDDFGDQGSYYLASSRNLAEFRSVQSLIRTIINELGISYRDVIALGSSKGGTAALLHGVALGIGHVYSGAPQYRIGDFVRTPHPNVLKYISGGEKEADVAWANDIARKLISSGIRSTPVSVIVGRGDGHHRHHTVPLVDELRMFGYKPEHLVLPGTSHSEFGGVFRKFVMTLVQHKLDNEFMLPHSIAYDPTTAALGIVVSAPQGATAQAQLLRGTEKVGKLTVVRDGKTQWQVREPGLYRARVYVDLPGELERQAFGTTTVRV